MNSCHVDASEQRLQTFQANSYKQEVMKPSPHRCYEKGNKQSNFAARQYHNSPPINTKLEFTIKETAYSSRKDR